MKLKTLNFGGRDYVMWLLDDLSTSEAHFDVSVSQ